MTNWNFSKEVLHSTLVERVMQPNATLCIAGNIILTSLSLFPESPIERVGRRRSMPGSTMEKPPPTIDSGASTPFRVTVSPADCHLQH